MLMSSGEYSCVLVSCVFWMFFFKQKMAYGMRISDWSSYVCSSVLMPIEVMASRGPETLRHGPMKPMGLDDPHTGRWPYAVVQLRQDKASGTLWNMVGFQTKLKHGAQVELFRTIPGLEKAEFAQLGGLHRHTLGQNPQLLAGTLRLKSAPNEN